MNVVSSFFGLSLPIKIYLYIYIHVNILHIYIHFFHIYSKSYIFIYMKLSFFSTLVFSIQGSINRIYGFFDECKRNYNVKLWRAFCDVFEWMPVAGIGKYHTIVSFFFLFIFFIFFLFCTSHNRLTQRFDNFLFFFSSNLLLPSSCLHFSPCHHPSYLSMIYIQYQNEFFVRMVVSHHIWNTWIKYVCFLFYFPINYYYLIMILTLLRIYDLNIFFIFYIFYIFNYFYAGRLQRPTPVPDEGLLCDLLWSDPEPEIRGWADSDRGVSYVFGTDVISKFLQVRERYTLCLHVLIFCILIFFG